MIQPEWHGWMHHTYDEVPESYIEPPVLPVTDESNAIYDTHVGLIDAPVSTEQNNLSQYRLVFISFILHFFTIKEADSLICVCMHTCGWIMI